MKYFLVIILFFALNLAPAGADELRPFKTDYCTNFPEGTIEYPELWKDCCLNHDLLMWAGGNKRERGLADLDLKSCIEDVGAPHIARLMYYAVRAGSYSPIKYPDMKWNNGWQARGDYQSLSLEDIEKIESELNLEEYSYIATSLKLNFLYQLRLRLD